MKPRVISLIFILLISTLPFNAQSQSVIGSGTVLSEIDDVFGLHDSRILLKNNSHIQLFEMSNNTMLDTKPCSGFIRINADADIVMCSNGIYSISNTNLTLIHNSPISELAQPATNYTLNYYGNFQNNNAECIRTGNTAGGIEILNGSNTVKSIPITFRHTSGSYETIIIKFAFIHENSNMITLIFQQGDSSNYCSGSVNWIKYTFNYTTTNSLHFNRGGGGSWGSVWASGGGSVYFHDIQNGAVAMIYHNSEPIIKTIQLASSVAYPDDEGGAYTIGYMRPGCSITATEVGVSGDYVTLQDLDYPVAHTPSSIACNSPKNASMIVNGNLVTLWNDADADGHNDLNDDFISDSTQWQDIDGDGYGDNPGGNNPDSCPSVFGTSSIDMFGCMDNDGDGVSNSGDVFPRDSTQVNDTDQDGYGDNLTGNQPDFCPLQFGTSVRNNTLGCPDNDYDGWANLIDEFENDSSQWWDSDRDGFGDELNGFEGDSCPFITGNSIFDKYGCPDFDDDGWSDLGDDFPLEKTQWQDNDGDGYGDNQSIGANLVDAFPLDGTQWNDSDGDGYGDNRYGSQGDKFPNDPLRWEDTDEDGITDYEDSFPTDITQWNDTDGDGYGDELTGNGGDDCPFIWGNSTADRRGCIDTDGDGWSDERDDFPSNPNEYLDTDGDGVSDEFDIFPFDPTQTEDRDGDGMGDNPMGIGADKFPDDPTQWGDIDGDGYGDNPLGNNPDVFITDATQWFDEDGDGYGDNPTGRLYDQFPQNPTQWEDADEDGLGDNQSGTDADPFLNDFDNDGYNDSIDILPKLSSPGDLDADGCLDEVDAFPSDSQECIDTDGDGVGNNADSDDDGDGWTDADEFRLNADPLSASSQPVDSFEIVIPGTAVGLGAWDLIGIFGGVPLFAWIGFGFATRNGRCARYEELLKEATSRDELEQVALRWEYSLMLRMLGPHQGIRLERLRAELDDKFENATYDESEIGYDQTSIVENEGKDIPPINNSFAGPTKETVATSTDDSGYEWFKNGEENWYRPAGSNDEWFKFEN